VDASSHRFLNLCALRGAEVVSWCQKRPDIVSKET
jgi:hypothetical protein